MARKRQRDRTGGWVEIPVKIHFSRKQQLKILMAEWMEEDLKLGEEHTKGHGVNINGNCKTNHKYLTTSDGRTATMTEWAKITGIPYQTIKTRIRNNWDVDKAISLPSEPRVLGEINWNGKVHTFSSLAREAGISVAAMHQRIRSGWSVEDAVSKPIDERKSKPVRYITASDGRSATKNEWSKITGISRDTISSRIRLGWTPDEILGFVERTPQYLVASDGRAATMTEWSRITGIPYDTIRYRIKNNWDVDKALDIKKEHCAKKSKVFDMVDEIKGVDAEPGWMDKWR